MNWREIGQVPYDRWRDVLTALNSPVAVEGRRAYEAAGEHSALCLAQMLIESRAGTQGKLTSAKNPLGLRPRPGDTGPVVPGPFRAFASWTDAIAYWYSKITDPGYAYAKTVTLEEYIHVYAPASDGNNEHAYVATILRYLQEWGVTMDAAQPLTFGRVPHPAAVDRVAQVAPVNTAWDDLGLRVIRGVTWHRMQGTLWGTDSYFRNDGRARALTDYGIGVGHVDGQENDGTIFIWNDPRGRRAPWASGPYSASGSYGDGRVFVSAHGVNAINRDRVSIEIAGYFPWGPVSQDTPLTEKARQAIASLTAYWADQARIPWHLFPMVPGQAYSFVCWHDEFCGSSYKPCPGPVVKQETGALIARIKEILRQYQISHQEQREEEPPAMPADQTFYSEELLKRLFGRISADGKTYTYSEQGPVSQVWLAECKRRGVFPALVEVINLPSERAFRFANGMVIVHRRGKDPEVI